MFIMSKIKMYDRVVFKENNSRGTVVGYLSSFLDQDKDEYVLVVFDENHKFHKGFLHDGNSHRLTDGRNTADLNINGARCYYCTLNDIEVEYSINDIVKIDNQDYRYVGAVNSGPDFLIVEPTSFRCTKNSYNMSRWQTIDNKSLSSLINTENTLYSYARPFEIFIRGKLVFKQMKPISGFHLKDCDPCRTEFEKFIKEHGFFNEIEWSKEIEDKFMCENGWITFLISKSFIS